MSDRQRKMNWCGILKGILFAAVITFLLILGLAAVCYFAAVPEKLISVLTLAASGIGVLLGAAAVAKSTGYAGLWHGLLLACGYAALLWISGVLVQKSVCVSLHSLSVCLCVFACGMLGGILGVGTCE